MIQEYDFNPVAASGTDPAVLYEKYVDSIGQILNDCALFDSVDITKPSSSGTYDQYYVEAKIDDKTVVKFDLSAAARNAGSGTSAQVIADAHRITAYCNNGNTSAITVSPTLSGTTVCGIVKAYVTSNGVLFKFVSYAQSASNRTFASVIIGKSNKDFPIIVGKNTQTGVSYSSGSLYSHTYGVFSMCYSDASYLTSNVNTNSPQYYKYNTTARQTEMFPFVAYGASTTDQSYSKCAVWLPYAPNSIRNGGYQKVLVNGDAYVTDGYFALKDG